MEKKFTQIRYALEEHLSSINENTAEIQGLFDFLQEMEIKVERLTQRMESFQLHSNPKPTIMPLNQIEKKVFLSLYTEETPLSYQELAVKLNMPLAVIQDCVSSLVSKGIPFQRSYYNQKLFLQLRPEFKERQAKENLINLSLQSFMN